MIRVRCIVMSIENTLKIIKYIEFTHKNLGLPTLWSKIVDLANLGTFLVAERGRGKGSVLSAIEKLRHRDVIKINILTYKGLKKLEERLSNNQATIINRDLSSLYTDYLKDVGLNVLANLITDHGVKAETGQYSLQIENAYISFIGGCQPQLLNRLNKLAGWEGMYKDRFMRFYFIYLRPVERIHPAEPDVPQIEYIDPEQVSIPSEIREDKRYKRLLNVIAEQTSENRAVIYTQQLLKAHAGLNERTVVVHKDLDVLNALILNLKLDTLLSRRDYSVSEPPVLDAGAYLILFDIVLYGEVSRKALREKYKVSYSTIVRDMDILMSRGVVKGTYGKDRYTLNPKFYDVYVHPQVELLKEAEVE